MDKITRKELKSDKFAQEVGQTVEFLAHHLKQVKIYAGIGGAVLLIVLGALWFNKTRRQERQSALTHIYEIQQAPIRQSAMPGDTSVFYPTNEAQQAALRKALEDLVAKYAGSAEAYIAHFMLGTQAADDARLDEAARHLQLVAANASTDYASLAKLSLSQILEAQGKPEEAEKLLRELVEKPTLLVSKEQATLELARVIGPRKPEEARKLLDPLTKSTQDAVSRNASAVLAQVPAR